MQNTDYGKRNTEIHAELEFQGYEVDKALYLELILWVVSEN